MDRGRVELCGRGGAERSMWPESDGWSEHTGIWTLDGEVERRGAVVAEKTKHKTKKASSTMNERSIRESSERRRK